MVAKSKRQPDPPHDSSTESDDKHKRNCTHVTKAVDLNKLRKAFTKAKKESPCEPKCFECTKIADGIVDNVKNDDEKNNLEYDKTLWMCLNCAVHMCRTSEKHYAVHFEKQFSDLHAIMMNTTTFEVFCFNCNSSLNVQFDRKLEECRDIIQKDKKNRKISENIQNNLLIISPLLDISSNYASPNKQTTTGDELPRVRGLSNLGNTCFFNAVLQCLAQTPYLLTTLTDKNKDFELPGGKHEFKNGEVVNLPPIKGTLDFRSPLTERLAEALRELQKSGGVYNPQDLFKMLTTKCPQFSGGDQHDSHELLRHLLESVRGEDTKRYHSVILNQIGFSRDCDVPEEIKQKCKFYGTQVQERILIPEQVFQGKLVSTLVCQDCQHTSPRHENFLDISLPINVETPKPPQRHKAAEPVASVSSPSKHKTKKEKERDKKMKRTNRHHNKGNTDVGTSGKKDENDSVANNYRSSSSCEHSDADVEDNLIEDAPKNVAQRNINRMVPPLYDSNGNNEVFISPNSPEKRDECPENLNKDSDDDEHDSGISTSPSKSAVQDSHERPSSRCDFASELPNEPKFNNTLVEATISTEGCAKLMRQHSENLDETLVQECGSLKVTDRRRRNRTFSSMEWSSTIAPRYTCEDNECSIQSCLNNFTAIELMSGNNKVRCDACTEDFKGKTINTNATKQFLIYSPPAVLILHLKRFQVGPRYMFRKLSKPVTFPFVLDVAPFCVAKVKNLPNVKPNQKKIMYSLYGIVEHSGGMHGGHYTAYVKVRPQLSADDPRWKFLPSESRNGIIAKTNVQPDGMVKSQQKTRTKERYTKCDQDNNDSDDSLSSTSSSEQLEGACGGTDDPDFIEPLPGKWYYVSDSQVQEVTEESVLNAQAYLLFYERIY